MPTCANCSATKTDEKWIKAKGKWYCSAGCQHNTETLSKYKGKKGAKAGLGQMADGAFGGPNGSMSADNIFEGLLKVIGRGLWFLCKLLGKGIWLLFVYTFKGLWALCKLAFKGISAGIVAAKQAKANKAINSNADVPAAPGNGGSVEKPPAPGDPGPAQSE
jgi:hypothetical protein